MSAHFGSMLRVLALACLCLGVGFGCSRAAEQDAKAEEATFEMREVSVFKKNDIQPSFYRLTVGQYAVCTPEPDKEVKAYPELKSKRPLYGKVEASRKIVLSTEQSECGRAGAAYSLIFRT